MKGLDTGAKKTYSNASSWRKKAAEREFEKLYSQSYSLVYNYVRSRMAGDDVAEDVVSEAFLQAARHFDSYDPSRSKFSTWVTKIAINRMKDYWRREKPTAPIDEALARNLSEPDEQERYADRDLVDRLLGVLNPDERNLVVMKYREGYRNIEIASELEMNASTVSTKLANALAKMRVVAERGR